MLYGRDVTVGTLLDRAAIRDVLLRYARGVDRRDLAMVRACFTPECGYEGTLARGTIADALASLEERLGRYAGTMHLMGNQLITVDGDTATSETSCVAYHRLAGNAADFVTGVRYLDDFVRDGDHWRIRRRAVRLDWQRHDGVALPA
jgi:3-phenylpropionate/cinnamic acid dioxygenase small subunit